MKNLRAMLEILGIICLSVGIGYGIEAFNLMNIEPNGFLAVLGLYLIIHGIMLCSPKESYEDKIVDEKVRDQVLELDSYLETLVTLSVGVACGVFILCFFVPTLPIIEYAIISYCGLAFLSPFVHIALLK